MADRTIDGLIWESRATRAAAAKACSDAIEIKLKARHLQALIAMLRAQRGRIFPFDTASPNKTADADSPVISEIGLTTLGVSSDGRG